MTHKTHDAYRDCRLSQYHNWQILSFFNRKSRPNTDKRLNFGGSSTYSTSNTSLRGRSWATNMRSLSATDLQGQTPRKWVVSKSEGKISWSSREMCSSTKAAWKTLKSSQTPFLRSISSFFLTRARADYTILDMLHLTSTNRLKGGGSCNLCSRRMVIQNKTLFWGVPLEWIWCRRKWKRRPLITCSTASQIGPLLKVKEWAPTWVSNRSWVSLPAMRWTTDF